MKMTDCYGEGAGLTERRRIRKGRALLGAALLLTALGLMLPRTSAAGGWGYTAGPLGTARYSHTATLLANGKVLVAGGFNERLSVITYLNSAELYNPDKGAFTPTGAMASARAYHTATLLPNGKVLVVGGMYVNGFLATAELYDPVTGAWTPTGSLSQAHAFHTATLLPNGKVLVAGGRVYEAGGYWGITGAELYDPATATWSATGSLNVARGEHSATLLSDGRVLVAGGKDCYEVIWSEIYDPDSGQWSSAVMLGQARSYHAAALLANGKVLVAGGNIFYDKTNSAEIYNTRTNSWKNTGNLKASRADHTAILLPNGKVLVAGGEGFYSASAEIYDPADDTWGSAGDLKTARIEHTVTLLNNGLVLVIGGLGTGYESLASAEIYPKGLGFPPPKPPTRSGINLLLLD